MSKRTREQNRLIQDKTREVYWKRWGPYLSERQWATVREDYSDNGDAWSSFSHEDAVSRAFRWGEDGIAGFCDTHALECLSFAFWNEKDDILKERLFGLTSHEGNHGEDVKEEYFYLDNTPTHSYMNYQYKYPQKPFPYEELRKVNGERSREEREFELVDTGVFEDNRYFDIFIETAKKDDDDPEDSETAYIRVTAYNRGPEPATLSVLPQITFRNTWAWGNNFEEEQYEKPWLKLVDECGGFIETYHEKLGTRYVQFADSANVEPKLLFTDNETNKVKLYGEDQENACKFTKDAFHEYVCNGRTEAVNPQNKGTKAAAFFEFKDIQPGESVSVRLCISPMKPTGPLDTEIVDNTIEQRLDEADDFYYQVSPLPLTDELRQIQRQAFAGMLWNKQFYCFIYGPWAKGDENATIKPKPNRANGRNADWRHLHIVDILSMPDKWEYPFFAAWDSAFHCIPLAMIDPEFAKKQLDVMVREWYLHPSGQLPAYEWNFSDVNPPVHAWATFRVYKIDRRLSGVEDTDFLERVFQKLLLNFTWWVNKKDAGGKGVFEGGFLGLDNIGLFNRSEPLPTGGTLEQADGTGWMGFYCLQMLNIALELTKKRPAYEDIASKFFEHFLFIADAMSYAGGDATEKAQTGGLWNEEDGFYYDCITWGPENLKQLPVRSLVGLIPLYASMTLDADVLTRYPKFARRVEWFIKHRPAVSARNLSSLTSRGTKGRLLLSLVNKDRLERILQRMLDEDEFLSPYGIRSLSRFHQDNPYSMNVHGSDWVLDYQPNESNSPMFGGNSNWRGPIWFPTNFLLIEALQRFYLFYGDELKVECPTRSGDMMNLAKVAENVEHRLINLFTRDDENDGRRPYNGGVDLFDFDDNFDDTNLFHEYFNPETGRGLGTKHQNGWTGLVAKMIHDSGVFLANPRSFTPESHEAAQEFFDEVQDVHMPRSRHHSRPRTLSRSSSTTRVVQNISDLLSRYNISEDQLGDDLQSLQN